jgi:hypothetical protein
MENYTPKLTDVPAGQFMADEVLPGVPFRIGDRKWIPLSWKSGWPSYSLDLGGKHYSKVYLLLSAILENQDAFVPPLRVSLRATDGTVQSTLLHSPGQLDWGLAAGTAGLHHTIEQPRDSRFHLLPMLQPDQGDWKAGKPPEFPQRELWASCRAILKPSIVMNVVELCTDPSQGLRSLSLHTLGADPAVALIAVSAMKPASEDPFSQVLFSLNQPEDLQGWKVEGEAFGVGKVPGMTALNSLSPAGEAATGTALSPEFILEGTALEFLYSGGSSPVETGPGALSIRLLDADTGERLAMINVLVPGNRIPQRGRIALAPWQGRRARLEIRDENGAPGMGWIALADVVLVK